MNNVSSYEGQKVLIMGGASGIGLSTTKAYLNAGAKVAVFDLNRDYLKKFENESKQVEGLHFLCFAGDVRNKERVDEVIENIIQYWDRIDVFIYSAGILPDRLLLEMTEEEWDTVMNINAKGAFISSQAVGKRMVKQNQGGHIITISSGSYQNARVGSGHYCASKGALVMLTKVLALELAPYGIMVNSIAPGLINNPLLSEEYKAAFTQRVPLGRVGEPEDVANHILAITNSDNTFMTGQVITIDGGMTTGHYGLPLSNK